MESPGEEPLESDTAGRWRSPEGFLAIASALLLAANVLLIFGVFLNFVGRVGGGTRARRSGSPSGRTSWAWPARDNLLPDRRPGCGPPPPVPADRGIPPHRLGRTDGLLALRPARGHRDGPAGPLRDAHRLAGGAARPGDRSAPVVHELLYLWIVCAALFLAAHVVILLDARAASADDWARGLPVYAWVVAAGISLAATILIVLSFVAALQGAPIAVNFGAWLIAKMVVAPNLFISGYASSLQLGRSAARARSARRAA